MSSKSAIDSIDKVLVIHGIVLTCIFFLFFQRTTPPVIPYPQPIDVMMKSETPSSAQQK